MRKITGPNWPEWPTAWIDERKKLVRVTGRAPTWRGYQKASWGVGLLTLGMFGLGFIALVVTCGDDPSEADAGRFLVGATMGVVAWGLFAWAILFPYLFNVHYAKGFVLDLTPEHIRINGKKFKRQQPGGQLEADFRITEDNEAVERINVQKIENVKARHMAATSRKIQLIVRGRCDHGTVTAELLGPGQVFTMLSVIGNEKAELCSVTCQAAEALVQRLAEFD